MPDNKQGINTALEKVAQFALVETNPKVLDLSAKFRWRPTTVITRIQRALPAVVEQQIYLTVGPKYRIRPDSLKTILRTYLGQRELRIEDLAENIAFFNQVDEYLDNVFEVVDKTSLQYTHHLSMLNASKFVIRYGEHSEEIIDSISTHASEISAILHIHTPYRAKVIAICIDFLINKIMRYCDSRGMPDLTDIMDYFSDYGNLCRGTLNRSLGVDEPEDYNPMHLRQVKELGYYEW